MAETHTITREIGIDMGHRVTNHHSKCQSVHGHRYRIIAECLGLLQTRGSSEGMVVDFGFLKDLMMKEIDTPFDHGLCLWNQDPLVPWMVTNEYDPDDVREGMALTGAFACTTKAAGKVIVVPDVPTAENLARIWFHRLGRKVKDLTQGYARLESVTVWETPNCAAVYRPEWWGTPFVPDWETEGQPF